MFSEEIREKAVSEFLISGLTYKLFCKKYYSYMNNRTLERWVHDYRVKNDLVPEYKSVKKVAAKKPITMVCYDMDKRNNNPPLSPVPEYESMKKVDTKEPITMVCYNMDKINDNPPLIPTTSSSSILEASKNYFFNITAKIQFQSDVINTYMDLTDVKYSDNNIIILKKIRGLCNEFTV